MKKTVSYAIFIILSMTMFAACNSGNTDVTPSPEPTSTVAPTITPEPTAIIAPTAVPEPPTFLAEQLTMPIISIDTLGKGVYTKAFYTDAKVTIWDETGKLDMDTTDISIRLRGNITLKLDKKSYRIKFLEKQNPLALGDGKGKSWNLVANYFDTSLLRNLTAYHLGEMLDHMPYTANACPVEVYVNEKYQGVYLLCEAVKVNKNRVAVTENPALIEENGYLVEMSRYAEGQVFTVDCCSYEVKSDVSEDAEVAAQQVAYIADYTQKALDALKSGDQTAVEQYIDIPSLIDNCIANEICKNVDAGWDSYYFSKDAGGKLTFQPMWDYDLALGNCTEAKGIADAEGLCIYNVTDSIANSNPWLCYALNCDWFRKQLTERWNEKVEELRTLPDFVTREAQANAPSYERNFTKWKTLGKQVYNEPAELADLTTHAEHAGYLADWLDARIEWLNQYYNSTDFTAGKFLDETGKEIDTENAVAVSALMFWGIDGEIDPESPGFTAEASTGWGGQAQAGGLMLQQGQTYKLSFDYSGSSEATVNYRIQANHDNYTPYMSGSLTVTEDMQHFETEFTANTSDFNCALVLEFKGAGMVKVEKMTFVEVE